MEIIRDRAKFFVTQYIAAVKKITKANFVMFISSVLKNALFAIALFRIEIGNFIV